MLTQIYDTKWRYYATMINVILIELLMPCPLYWIVIIHIDILLDRPQGHNYDNKNLGADSI